MFLIKNRALNQAVRNSRNLFKNDTKKIQTKPQTSKPVAQSQKIVDNTGFVMATEDHSKPFPYKFGGVSHSKKVDSRISSIMPAKIPNFFELYVELLNAIQIKDQNRLKTLVEPELLEPLLSHNVKLINKNSLGSFQYNTFATGLGICGPRNPKIKISDLSFLNMPITKDLGQNMKFYMPQSPTSMNQIIKSPISEFPLLISAEITIKSNARLIQLNSAEIKKQQTHILTFQRQATVNITSVISMLSGFKGSINNDKIKSLLYAVDHPWRVANIDNFLKDRWQP